MNTPRRLSLDALTSASRAAADSIMDLPWTTEYFEGTLSSNSSTPSSPSVKLEVEFLRAKMEKVVAENRQLVDDLGSCEEERDKLKSLAGKQSKALQVCREEANRWRTKFAEKEAEFEALDAIYKRLSEELTSIKADFKSAQANAEALSSENEKLQSDFGELVEQLENTCLEKEHYQRECLELRTDLNNARLELNGVKHERRSVMDQYCDLNTSIVQLKAEYRDVVDKRLEDQDEMSKLRSEIKSLRSRQPSFNGSCSTFNARLINSQRRKSYRRTASLNDLEDESSSSRSNSSGGTRNRPAEDSMSLPVVTMGASGVSLHQEMLEMCYDRLSRGQKPGEFRLFLEENTCSLIYPAPSPPPMLDFDDESLDHGQIDENERLHRYADLLLAWLRSIVEQVIKLQGSDEVEELMSNLPGTCVAIPKPDADARVVHACYFVEENDHSRSERRLTHSSSGYSSPGDDRLIEEEAEIAVEDADEADGTTHNRTKAFSAEHELDQLHAAVDTTVQVLTHFHQLYEEFVLVPGASPDERRQSPFVGKGLLAGSDSQRVKSSTSEKFRFGSYIFDEAPDNDNLYRGMLDDTNETQDTLVLENSSHSIETTLDTETATFGDEVQTSAENVDQSDLDASLFVAQLDVRRSGLSLAEDMTSTAAAGCATDDEEEERLPAGASVIPSSLETPKICDVKLLCDELDVPIFETGQTEVSDEEDCDGSVDYVGATGSAVDEPGKDKTRANNNNNNKVVGRRHRKTGLATVTSAVGSGHNTIEGDRQPRRLPVPDEIHGELMKRDEAGLNDQTIPAQSPSPENVAPSSPEIDDGSSSIGGDDEAACLCEPPPMTKCDSKDRSIMTRSLKKYASLVETTKTASEFKFPESCAFPSLPADCLNNSGNAEPERMSSEGMTAQDVERKFNDILIAFKTDRDSLSDRLDLKKRHRDTAEANMDVELHELKLNMQKLLSAGGTDSKVRELICSVQDQIEVLQESAVRISRAAEAYGQVQQENKVSKMTDILMAFVENQKRTYEREHAELEELKKLLSTSNLGAESEDYFGSNGAGGASGSSANGSSMDDPQRRFRTVSVATTASVRMQDGKQRSGSRGSARSVSVSDRCGSPVSSVASASSSSSTSQAVGSDQEPNRSSGASGGVICGPIVEEDAAARSRSGSGFSEAGGDRLSFGADGSSDTPCLRHRSDSQQSGHHPREVLQHPIIRELQRGSDSSPRGSVQGDSNSDSGFAASSNVVSSHQVHRRSQTSQTPSGWESPVPGSRSNSVARVRPFRVAQMSRWPWSWEQTAYFGRRLVAMILVFAAIGTLLVTFLEGAEISLSRSCVRMPTRSGWPSLLSRGPPSPCAI